MPRKVRERGGVIKIGGRLRIEPHALDGLNHSPHHPRASPINVSSKHSSRTNDTQNTNLEQLKESLKRLNLSEAKSKPSKKYISF